MLKKHELLHLLLVELDRAIELYYVLMHHWVLVYLYSHKVMAYAPLGAAISHLVGLYILIAHQLVGVRI